MPFNRAERQWVDHVCEDGSDVVPFGSTKVLTPGTPIFANGLFPALDDDFPPKPDFSKADATLSINWGPPNLARAMMTRR